MSWCGRAVWARVNPLVAALAWLLLVAAGLAAAAGGGGWLRRGAMDGATTAGAAVYGATVGATFLLIALQTVVLAQVFPTTAGARRGAMALVLAEIVLRGFGDLQDVRWVAAASPLGLRGAIRPFTDDDPLPLIAAFAVAAVLAAVTIALDAHREPGSGLIRSRARLTRRLHVRSPLALAARLGRDSMITWASALVVCAALLTAMGSGVITSAREGRLDGGFLADQLRGTDPAAAYFTYTGRVVGIAVAAFVIFSVLTAAADERSGRLEHLRATGLRRWSPLVAQTITAALGALLLLTLAALACAAVAATLIPGDGAAAGAFRETLGQWPATVALAGVGALLAGAFPRLSVLAWIPFGVSVLLTMLGSLLNVPDYIVRLGVFGHAPDTWSAVDLSSSAVLVAVGVALTIGGVAGLFHRDEVTG